MAREVVDENDTAGPSGADPQGIGIAGTDWSSAAPFGSNVWRLERM